MEREVRTSGHPARTTASVIIRAKNESRHLARTLEGVFAQDPSPHEVIVIDSGSTDDTVAVAERFPVIVIEMDPRQWNYSRALNWGAKRATGDVLVCLSAHCEPVGPHWLAALVRHFDDPAVAGVWGPSLRPDRDEFTGGEALRQLPGTYTVHNRTWGLSNGNSAVRRAFWDEVPFDEAIPATEDKAWGLAMLDRGRSIVHDPEAAVWHEVHTVANDYRRNLAVQAGFRQIFPELEEPYGSQLRIVGRRTLTLLRARLSSRDLGALWLDVKRVPGVAAALAGGIVGVRPGAARRSWDTRRHPSAPVFPDASRVLPRSATSADDRTGSEDDDVIDLHAPASASVDQLADLSRQDGRADRSLTPAAGRRKARARNQTTAELPEPDQPASGS